MGVWQHIVRRRVECALLTSTTKLFSPFTNDFVLILLWNADELRAVVDSVLHTKEYEGIDWIHVEV